MREIWHYVAQEARQAIERGDIELAEKLTTQAEQLKEAVVQHGREDNPNPLIARYYRTQSVSLTEGGNRKVLELVARAKSIVCPTCSASAGDYCTGSDTAAGIHLERLRASKVLEQSTPTPRGDA